MQGGGNEFAFTDFKKGAVCLSAEIKTLELLPGKHCLLHQKPHTAAQESLIPKPEHLQPLCHGYNSTVALALGVLPPNNNRKYC